METPTTPEGMTGALIPRPNDTATTGEIATLIENAMTINGLTQGALAVAMGISGGQLTSAKTGRFGLGTIPLAKLKKLAESSDAPLPAIPAPITPGPVAAPDLGPIKLPLLSLTVDLAIQQRVSTDDALVVEYSQDIRAWIAQAPIDVFGADGKYIVADGFTRTNACLAAEMDYIYARVHPGTRRDALLFAIGANRAHGLRRSNEDKHRAVETLLQDPEWSQWSDRRIAEQVGVSDKTVAAARRGISNCGISAVEPTGPADAVAPVAAEVYRPHDDDEPAPAAPKRIGRDGKARSAPTAKTPAPTTPPKVKAPTAKDAMRAAHAVTASLVALEKLSAALLPSDRAPLVEHLRAALLRYAPEGGHA
jgi:transcriptional regulator with XRE-family HTH domain/transposase-like protein